LLHRLSRLATDVPEIAEVDLNPVVARSADCQIADARIRIVRTSRGQTTKTW
jgi:hypothetical protein